MTGKPKAKFRDEPLRVVLRRLLCEACNGEMISTGDGFTQISTSWKHRCNKCGVEVWTQHTYPGHVYLPAMDDGTAATLEKVGSVLEAMSEPLPPLNDSRRD